VAPLLDPELLPELDPLLDPELLPELDPLLDPELLPELDPLLDPELLPELEPLLDPELLPLLDPEPELLAEPELDPEPLPELLAVPELLPDPLPEELLDTPLLLPLEPPVLSADASPFSPVIDVFVPEHAYAPVTAATSTKPARRPPLFFMGRLLPRRGPRESPGVRRRIPAQKSTVRTISLALGFAVVRFAEAMGGAGAGRESMSTTVGARAGASTGAGGSSSGGGAT